MKIYNTAFDTTYEITSFLIPISDLFADVVSYVRSYIVSNVRFYVLFDIKKRRRFLRQICQVSIKFTSF